MQPTNTLPPVDPEWLVEQWKIYNVFKPGGEFDVLSNVADSLEIGNGLPDQLS